MLSRSNSAVAALARATSHRCLQTAGSNWSLYMQAAPSLLFELELEDAGELGGLGALPAADKLHAALKPASQPAAQLLQDATALAATCRGGGTSSTPPACINLPFYAEKLGAQGYAAWLRTGTAGGCSDWPVMRHTFVVVALPHTPPSPSTCTSTTTPVPPQPFGPSQVTPGAYKGAPGMAWPDTPVPTAYTSSSSATPKTIAYPTYITSTSTPDQPALPIGCWSERELLIVDPSFKDQFVLELGSSSWQQLWSELPEVFVGSAQQLHDVVTIVAAELAEALEGQGRELPPWRQAAAMMQRWLPTAASDTDVSASANLLIQGEGSASPLQPDLAGGADLGAVADLIIGADVAAGADLAVAAGLVADMGFSMGVAGAAASAPRAVAGVERGREASLHHELLEDF